MNDTFEEIQEKSDGKRIGLWTGYNEHPHYIFWYSNNHSFSVGATPWLNSENELDVGLVDGSGNTIATFSEPFLLGSSAQQYFELMGKVLRKAENKIREYLR